MTQEGKDLQKLMENFYPNVCNALRMRILWNATCFPFGTYEQIKANVQDNVKRFGNNKKSIIKTLNWAHRTIEKDMRKINENSQ